MTGDEPSRGRGRKVDPTSVVVRPYFLGFAEMELFPDEASRRKAIGEIEQGMTPRSLRGWIILIGIATPLMLIPFFGIARLLETFAPSRFTGWLALILAIPIYWGLVSALIRGGMPRTIRRKLLDAGVPVCLKCGYDLRTLRSDRCPECGRRISRRACDLLEPPPDPSGGPSDGTR